MTSRLKGSGLVKFGQGTRGRGSSGDQERAERSKRKWQGKSGWKQNWNTAYPITNLKGSTERKLIQISNLKPNCEACPGRHLRNQHRCVFPEFYKVRNQDDAPTLMIVAEAPGEIEDEENRTLVGRSGQLIRFLLRYTDLGDYHIYLTNIAKCKPPAVTGRKGSKKVAPSPDMVRACAPTLYKEIEKVKPAVIVAAGLTAAKQLIDLPEGVNWKVNQFRTAGQDGNGGHWYNNKWGIATLVTYHPAAVVRNPYFGPFLHFDLAKAALYAAFDLEKYRKPGKVRHLRTLKDLEAAVKRAESQEFMAWDYETTNLSRCRGGNKALGLMWAHDICEGYGVLIDHPDASWTEDEKPKVNKLIRELLTNKCTKIAHNAKFDMAIARITAGVQVKRCLYDTMIMQYQLDENIASLKKGAHLASNLEDMSKFWLDYEDPAWKKMKGMRARLASLDGEKVVAYGTVDAILTFRLWKVMTKLLEAKDPKVLGNPTRVLSRITNVLAEIEVAGLPVDIELARDYLDPDHPDSIKGELNKRCAALLETPEIKRFNHEMNEDQDKASLFAAILDQDESLFVPTNTHHLVKFYYDFMGFEVPASTKEGKFPTGKEFEEVYAEEHPIVQAIKEYKELAKMQSFVKIFIEEASKNSDKRIRASYHHNRTVTGRLACTDPNNQQIPRASDNPVKARIKRLIKAPPGYAFVQADYSAAEVRVGAFSAKDEVLAGVFKRVRDIIMDYRNKPTVEAYTRVHINGEADIHKQNYSTVFDIPVEQVTKTQRTEAKAITFGCMFSEEPEYQLAGKLKCSPDEAKVKVDRFLGPFENLVKYLKSCSAEAEDIGYVYSGFGRLRWVYGGWSLGKDHRHSKNQAQNSPIQSTSSDITLLAAHAILSKKYREKLNWQIVNAVHDALYLLIPIAELPAALIEIEKIMLNPGLEEFGIDPDFVPLEVDFEVGINGADVVGWDFTPQHMALIISWLKAGGHREERPQSPFEPQAETV